MSQVRNDGGQYRGEEYHYSSPYPADVKKAMKVRDGFYRQYRKTGDEKFLALYEEHVEIVRNMPC